MGNKVNPNLFRLSTKTNNLQSFWSVHKYTQYKLFLYQDNFIRDFSSYVFSQILKLPLGDLKIIRDTNNNLFIHIPFCGVSSYIFKKNFSRIKFLSSLKKKKNILGYKSIIKEKVAIRQRSLQIFSFLLQKKILFFTKSLKISLTFNNHYNKITRHFFSTVWGPTRRLDFKLKRHSFYTGMPAIIGFTCLNESPKTLLNLCTVLLKNASENKHHLVLNTLQTCLPLYVSELPKIKGLRIQVSGNIQGSERKKKRVVQVGQVPVQSFNSQVKCEFGSIITKHGSLGIKVWIHSDCLSPRYKNQNFHFLTNKCLANNANAYNVYRSIRSVFFTL